MKTPRCIALQLVVIIIGGACLLQSCQKQGDAVTDPLSQKPDRVTITSSRDTLLTGGRDSSLWSIQLYQGGTPFQKAYSVLVLTDLGYFLQGNSRVHRAVFTTDGSGKLSVFFYGDNAGGFDYAQIWGDGFGPMTKKSVLVFGEANALTLEFRDPANPLWGITDTLRAGTLRGKADSTFIRVSVFDRNLAPLSLVHVDLDVYVNGARPTRSRYGYFKSTVKPDSVSSGYASTDAQGQAVETFYTDLFPTTGQALVQIVAQVDAGTFGRISSSRYVVITR